MVVNPIASVAPVPCLWPDSTIVCLGSGSSLTQADVDYCRGRARVIAIKDTYRLAPWADVLYSGDERWWEAHGETLRFDGLKFGMVSPDRKWVDLFERIGVHRLIIGDATRLEADPRKLASGNTSGFQTINLARHLGARLVVLLGYDMKANADGRVHFFGAHEYKHKKPPFQWLDAFTDMPASAARLGLRIVNATRDTALTVFDRCSLEEALA